jgi:hypothetical protein
MGVLTLTGLISLAANKLLTPQLWYYRLLCSQKIAMYFLVNFSFDTSLSRRLSVLRNSGATLPYGMVKAGMDTDSLGNISLTFLGTLC